MASRAYPGKAADPKTKVCDWCGKPGVKAIELRKPGKHVYGTGQFLYPCSEHVAIARRSMEAVRAPAKREKL